MVTLSPNVDCGIAEIFFFDKVADETLSGIFKVVQQNGMGQF